MTLAEHIDDIRNKLENGNFQDVFSVSHGILLRLLQCLNWPCFDTDYVSPGRVAQERMDYILNRQKSKPEMFVVVKPPGSVDVAVAQLYNYAASTEARIALFTDGRVWQFYLAEAEKNESENARVKAGGANLEDSVEDISKCLTKYLDFDSVCSGEAYRAIVEDRQDKIREKRVGEYLVKAWDALIEEQDEFLLDIITEKTESLCDHKPTKDQVMDYLKRLKTTPSPEPVAQIIDPFRLRGGKAKPSRLRVTINGKVIDHHNATQTWIDTIIELNPQKVMDKDFEARLVSNTPKFRQHYRYNKYYICKDYGTKEKKKQLERIASRLGVPIEVEMIPKQ